MNIPPRLKIERTEWSRTLTKPAIIIMLIGVFGAALLVPHLVAGHLLSLSVPETQSLLIGIDLLIAGTLMAVLNHQIVKEKVEKEVLQRRLNSSFRYIGQANVCIELIQEHSVALAGANSSKEAHQALSHLHDAIAAGVAGATAARMRVISVDTGRTVTEYVWPQGTGCEPPSISNKVVMGEPSPPLKGEGSVVIRSAIQKGGVLCVFAGAIPSGGKVDTELLQVLLNHFHLLFLFGRDHYKELL